MESKCRKFFNQAKTCKFSKIYIIHTIFIYVYKSFSAMLDKDLRKNIKKKRRDGEIGKHKLNEMGAQNMNQKKMKQTR